MPLDAPRPGILCACVQCTVGRVRDDTSCCADGVTIITPVRTYKKTMLSAASVLLPESARLTFIHL